MKLIVHDQYINLADCEFSAEKNTIPESGSIVFVHMEHIPLFFRTIENTDNKYIIISANSDYGICYQSEHPVYRDMQKWFNFISVDENIGYKQMSIPGRCSLENCKITDRFSIKVYSYTLATFNEIPKNVVRWFCTNADIDDDRIIHIPQGIASWQEENITNVRNKGSHTDSRIRDIYVNMQMNTLERVSFINMFANTYPSISNRSHSEYIDDLTKYNNVISLSGNGFDCFRTLEGVYCGCIPIIIDTRFNRAYNHIPSIKINNFGQIDAAKKINFDRNISLDDSPADMLYWERRVAKAKTEM